MDLIIFLIFGMSIAGIIAMIIDYFGCRLGENLFQEELMAWKELKR